MTLAREASRRSEAVAKVKREFEPRGFRAIDNPDPEILPEWLRPFRPDMILLGPERNMAVEFREFPGSIEESEKSGNLARETRKHERWNHLLMLLEPEPYTVPSAEEIGRAIEEFDNPTPETSRKLDFVRAWAVFEAAARSAGEKLDPEGKARRLPTIAVLEKLASLGALDDAKVSELEDLAAIRNRLVHGGLDTDVPSTGADTLLREARQLVEADA